MDGTTLPCSLMTNCITNVPGESEASTTLVDIGCVLIGLALSGVGYVTLCHTDIRILKSSMPLLGTFVPLVSKT